MRTHVGILPEEVALKYFTEMLEGYKSIYERNAFHRDLKVVLPLPSPKTC